MTDAFPAIPPEREQRWTEQLNAEAYLRFAGLRFEEIRLGYARVRLSCRPELHQGDGVVHGGAIAALADTAAVGAVLSAYDERPRRMATTSLFVQYLGSVRTGDVLAEARVRRRGRTVAFVEVDVVAADGGGVAHAELTWFVADPTVGETRIP